jgi:cellulose biosynthesis protein BcsQ
LRKILLPLVTQYDYVFLDCAPSISLTSESILYVADIVLIPTIPTTLSLRTLQQLLKFRDKKAITGLHLVPFFSMVDNRKEMHRRIIRNPPDTPEGLMQHWIPNSSDVEKMGIHRMPVTEFAPSSPAAQAYSALWAELKEKISDVGYTANRDHSQDET